MEWGVTTAEMSTLTYLARSISNGSSGTWVFQLPKIPGVHVVTTWFLGVVSLLGVILNVLAIAVLLRKENRSSTSSFYLLNLALGDLFICCGLPTRVLDYEGRIDWSTAGCLSYTTLRFLPIYVSINTMILVAIERHCAIVTPSHFKAFTARRKVVMQLVGVWLVSLAEVSYLLSRAKAVFVFVRHYCIIYDTVSTVTFNFLTVVGLPSVALLLIYGHIFYTVWSKQSQPVQPESTATTGNDAARRRRRRAIKMAQVLFLIAILFMVCWLPTLALWYDYMARPFLFFFSPSFAMFQACSVMIFAHSCVNPIIYFSSNTTYRRSLWRILTCGTRGQKTHPETYQSRSQSTSATTTTR